MYMVDRVRSVLASLGGEATLQSIYDEIHHQYSMSGKQADIRKEIQRQSSASVLWNGARPDYFYSVHGKGKGVWGLR